MNKEKMFSSASDTWDTPDNLWKLIKEEFDPKLDVACLDYSAKCTDYYTPQDDGLSKEWYGVCWMNPPYGRVIKDWVKKAYEESLKDGVTVVCLLPARTDTRWFHDYCMKGEVRLIKGRLKFENRSLPSWKEDGSHKISPAPFPSMVVIFGEGVECCVKSWNLNG